MGEAGLAQGQAMPAAVTPGGFPPSLGGRSSGAVQKHVRLRTKMRKMESYLKSHQSLFPFCVCCGLKKHTHKAMWKGA